jgi:hypothetical protein
MNMGCPKIFEVCGPDFRSFENFGSLAETFRFLMRVKIFSDHASWFVNQTSEVCGPDFRSFKNF